MRVYFLFLTVLLCFGSCIVPQNKYAVLPPGPWRGVFKLDPSTTTPVQKGKNYAEKLVLSVQDKKVQQFEEVTRGELPFQFEVSYGAEDSLIFTFTNGTERIETRDIELWHDRVHNRDSIRIHFKEYNTYLQAAYRESVLEGHWIKPDKNYVSIPFVAHHGQSHRFSTTRRKPVADISGAWATEFFDDEETYPAIGEFKQDGENLTGTFRTETGDYRFLQGSMLGDKMYLSCFDGSHAFLFEGKFENNEITGIFRSGKKYKAGWSAKRDPNFKLADTETITQLKGDQSLAFNFTDTDGKTWSNADLKGKVTLIEIMGTWCPNCKDESEFIKSYIKSHPEQDIQVIGLAFEYPADTLEAIKRLKTYRQKMGISYPICYAGKADKKVASALFPMLSGITSFPTLLVLDKQVKIKHIYTGFDGPATSKYAAFLDNFSQKILVLSHG
jgi:thiol-disulfide isomerase/thioredoxin